MLGVGQYSIEVARNPRAYFTKMARELLELKEEERKKELLRLNSMENRLQELVNRFKK